MKTKPIVLGCWVTIALALAALTGAAMLPAADTPAASASGGRYELHLNSKGLPGYLLDTTTGEVFKKGVLSWSSEVKGLKRGHYQLYLDANGELKYLCDRNTGEVYKKSVLSWSTEIGAVK